MLSKTLVLVIVAVITAGAAASVTTYYVVKAPTSQPAPSSQNNHTSNNSASGNELVISNHWYYFGVNPQNPFKETTYIFIQLSEPLIYNDFIHIYYHHYDLARWWVNKTQAYHSNISVPLDILTNLNGTINIEIMRGEKQLYNGTLKFITQPKIDVQLLNVSYYPVDYKFARVSKVKVEIKTSLPIYVESLSVKMSNATSHKDIDKVIFQDYENMDLWVEHRDNHSFYVTVANLKKGIYNINISVKYPLFPSNGELRYTAHIPYNLSFTCYNVSIASVTPQYDYDDGTTYLIFGLNASADCPLHLILYDKFGKEMGYSRIDKGENGTPIYIGDYFNFNGTYTAMLKDDMGFVMDNLSFTLYSGPLKLLNHTEETYSYSWENTTDLQSFTLTLKNEGNATAYLDSYNYSISYLSNGTIVKSEHSDWISEFIPAGEIDNVSLYPYVYLPNNETYLISVTFWGRNEDVKFSFTYQIRT